MKRTRTRPKPPRPCAAVSTPLAWLTATSSILTVVMFVSHVDWALLIAAVR